MSRMFLRETIRAYRQRDPAARSDLEVLLCYPGLHAVLLHRVAHWFWQRRLRLAGRFISHLARMATGIEIHPGATIGRRCMIDHGMGVVIGETAEIGDDCTLYHGVTLGGTAWQPGKRHPTLGNGVIVGAGAKVLGPVLVGDNARIGSNAVVVKAVPAGATVVGVPGRVISKGEGGGAFEAYGLTGQMPDPVARAVECMLEHMHRQDEEIARLRDGLLALQPKTEIPVLETLACSVEAIEEDDGKINKTRANNS